MFAMYIEVVRRVWMNFDQTCAIILYQDIEKTCLVYVAPDLIFLENIAQLNPMLQGKSGDKSILRNLDALRLVGIYKNVYFSVL